MKFPNWSTLVAHQGRPAWAVVQEVWLTLWRTKGNWHGLAAQEDSGGCSGYWLLELETMVHPKVRNHGEGPYYYSRAFS